MQRLILGALVSAGVWFSTAIAMANAPAPPRSPIPRDREVQAPLTPLPPTGKVVGQATIPVEIIRRQKLEGKEAFARLVIPKGMKVEGLRVQDLPQPAAEKQSSIGAVQTMVAGLAFSLAAVGMVFAFRGGRTAKIGAASLVLAAGLIGTWSAARADLSIPGVTRSRPPRPEPVIAPKDPREFRTLIIEVQEVEGDRATLYLSE